MNPPDDMLNGAHWRKSTRSNNGSNCVEVVGNLPGIVAVRDSKDPAGAGAGVRPGRVGRVHHERPGR